MKTTTDLTLFQQVQKSLFEFFDYNALMLVFLVLLLTLILAVFYKQISKSQLQKVSFTANIIVIFLIITMLYRYNIGMPYHAFQYIWLSTKFIPFPTLVTSSFYVFGVDTISLYFMLLTSFIFLCCINFATYTYDGNNLRKHIILLLALEVMLLGAFSALELYVFFILFEFLIYPLGFLLGQFSTEERRFRSSFLLIFYTLASSVTLLVAIVSLHYLTGTTNIHSLIQIGKTSLLDKSSINLLWVLALISFAAKMPILPLHIWLPEAHSEAPTTGSVLLAGVLLKAGLYGLLRFNVFMFSDVDVLYRVIVCALASLGVLTALILAFFQNDIKKIIAYSSVGHMCFILVALLSMKEDGIVSSIFQGINHGFVASGLFFLVGFLYARTHTRDIAHYQGLYTIAPSLFFFFFAFILANIALPLTGNFVAEALMLFAIHGVSRGMFLVNVPAIFLGILFNFKLLKHLLLGPIDTSKFIKLVTNLERYEIITAILLLIPIIFFGIYPDVILNQIKLSLPTYIHCGLAETAQQFSDSSSFYTPPVR